MSEAEVSGQIVGYGCVRDEDYMDEPRREAFYCLNTVSDRDRILLSPVTLVEYNTPSNPYYHAFCDGCETSHTMPVPIEEIPPPPPYQEEPIRFD